MGTIVVTGGAGALGSSLVRLLCERGERVAAVDTSRASDRLAALEREIGADKCAGFSLDVADANAWKPVLGAIASKLGDVTGAALIAGGWRGGAPVHASTDDDTLHAMMSANLATAHATMRALLPGLVSRGAGSIVVVGSRAVERPWTSAGSAAYAASKSALVALSQVVAAEVLERGVRVNAVLPSTIDTPANRAAMPDVDPSRWVSSASLAGVIAFLLSDAARDISGAAIPVYGRV